jgi:hypothetical protein
VTNLGKDYKQRLGSRPRKGSPRKSSVGLHKGQPARSGTRVVSLHSSLLCARGVGRRLRKLHHARAQSWRMGDPCRCGCRSGLGAHATALPLLPWGSADNAEPRHMETRPCGPSGAPAAAFLTVGELLNRWLVAYHDWRPTPGSRLVPTSTPLMAAASRDAGSRPSSPSMSGRLWRRRAPGKAVAPHQAGGIDF